jgi:hypothetical protein
MRALSLLVLLCAPVSAGSRAIPTVTLPGAGALPLSPAVSIPSVAAASFAKVPLAWKAVDVSPPRAVTGIVAHPAGKAASASDEKKGIPMAAIAKALSEAPPAAASVEDANAHLSRVVGLMTGETPRGPPDAPEGPDTAVVRVASVDQALTDLRRASFERHPDTDALIAKLALQHPGLPLDAERLFIVRDVSVLSGYGIPPEAAGAARIVSDGRREEKVVILVAPHGVALDDFVEYSIHEAVHLQDDGILRLPHSRFLEHWLAEGYTQLRAHRMANKSLLSLGRQERPNPAYSLEVAAAEALIALHGEEGLRALVTRGDTSVLARDLGARWETLSDWAYKGKRPRREDFLQSMRAMLSRRRA